jgi:hypothetical protein
MRCSSQAVSSPRWSVGLGILLSLLAVPGVALGQGCMPLRFTSPSLGGQQTPYFQAHEWQVGIAVRRVATNRFYVGDQEDETKAPGGQPLHLRLNSVDLSFAYATSERFSLALSVPLSYSTVDQAFPDLQRHQVSSGGVGDINLIGNLWLGAPSRHPNSNVSVGLGIKMPTGSNHVQGNTYDASGNVSQVTINQAVQLGDGGWAVLLQGQAFQQVFPRGSVYLSGFYSISLQQHTDVLFPAANTFWAVPDLYSARLGLSYGLMAEPGLSVSLGGRIDGTTVRDLVGGRTDFYRKAGYTMFVDPGLSLQSGPNQFILDVPVRVRHNYLSMLVNNGQTVRIGNGGVNDYVLYAGFSRRF